MSLLLLAVHQNYVGTDIDKVPFFLSVVLTDANDQCVPQYRAILWRKTVSLHAFLLLLCRTTWWRISSTTVGFFWPRLLKQYLPKNMINDVTLHYAIVQWTSITYKTRWNPYVGEILKTAVATNLYHVCRQLRVASSHVRNTMWPTYIHRESTLKLVLQYV